MGLSSTGVFLAFGCSIHCICLTILSAFFPFLNIQGVSHRVDLLLVIMSVAIAAFILLKNFRLIRGYLASLPMSAFGLGATLLFISLFIPSHEILFRVFGSLALAISNVYYLNLHRRSYIS